ncbi:MAG: hypothetical protein IJ192_09370, partial [Clostridia bacterium]|nr:hypothetical protein [Clostridia bacterium]
ERIFELPTAEMVEAMRVMINHPLREFIDLEKYLNSENENIIACVTALGIAKVRPCLAELQNFENSHRLEKNYVSKRAEYINEHTTICLLLKQTSMFGQPYWMIYSPQKSDTFIKTPDDNIFDIQLFAETGKDTVDFLELLSEEENV